MTIDELEIGTAGGVEILTSKFASPATNVKSLKKNVRVTH